MKNNRPVTTLYIFRLLVVKDLRSEEIRNINVISTTAQSQEWLSDCTQTIHEFEPPIRVFVPLFVDGMRPPQ